MLIVCSCNNKKPSGMFFVNTVDDSKLIVEFPNKPVLNIEENGVIQYKSDLDTILLNENNSRATILHMGVLDKKYSIEELKKMPLDRFDVSKDKYFPIRFTFDKEGEYVLNGYIEDKVFLKNHYQDSTSLSLLHEIGVSKKITVVKEYTPGDEKDDKLRVLLRFPDKSKINIDQYGEIIYKSYLDTIQLTEEDRRATVFFFGYYSKVHSILELEGKTIDSFRIRDDREYIPFGVTFEQEGEFILDGYVEDMVFLDNYYGEGNGRLITEQHKISKKVTVVKE